MKREVLDTFDAALSRFDDEPEVIELAPHEDEYDFLMKIVRSSRQPMSRRIRAAIEALPYRRPKLGAVAIGQLSGKDFATLLERAILRSQTGAPLKMIEASKAKVEGQGQ